MTDDRHFEAGRLAHAVGHAAQVAPLGGSPYEGHDRKSVGPHADRVLRCRRLLHERVVQGNQGALQDERDRPRVLRPHRCGHADVHGYGVGPGLHHRSDCGAKPAQALFKTSAGGRTSRAISCTCSAARYQLMR
jgi:hypothetical protein